MNPGSQTISPLLSGTCHYSNPPSWQLRTSGGEVRIEPDHWQSIGVLSFAVLFSIAVAAVAIFATPIVGVCCATPICAVMGGFCFYVLAGAWKDQIRGTHLIYDNSAGTLHLPRLNITLPASQIVQWRVVRGHWVGSDDKREKRERPISELQLLTHDGGAKTMYAIAGWCGPPMERIFKELSILTPWLVEVMDQPEGIEEPEPYFGRFGSA